jgi:oxygen-dependent protoporphyrinogen oxidase
MSILRFDCVVIGGGLAGLLAAYEASLAGKSVAIFEAARHCGGAIASVDIAGVRIDSGAESFAVTRPETLTLIAELGLSHLVVEPARSDARILINGEAHIIPHGMMGIPSDFTDAQTIAILGAEAAAHSAALDSAPWNITDEKTLGDVVAKRMGVEVVEKIVNPIVAGVHASDSYLLEMESVVPGLLAKAKSLGSLHEAVKLMRGTAASPGSAVAGINGGINLITRKLFEILQEKGVRIQAHSPVTHVSFDKYWCTTVGSEVIESDFVVLATNPIVARSILTDFDDLVGQLSFLNPIDVAVVLVALKAPELAAAPLGSGVLIADQDLTITAKASTHISAKWGWVKELVGDLELIRLSYGRNGIVDPSDQNLLQDAKNDLLVLYKVVDPEIVDAVVIRWPQSLIQARIGHQDSLKKMKESLFKYPGLAIIGSGVSGNGIAGVIGHTRKTMKELLNV